MLSDADRELLLVKVEQETRKQLRWARIVGWLLITLGMVTVIAVIGFLFLGLGIWSLHMARKGERKLEQGLADGTLLDDAEFDARIAREFGR